MVQCFDLSCRKLLSYLFGVILFIFVAAGVTLLYLLFLQPVYYFPRLTGPYDVGTRTLYFQSSRGDNLELVTQVWYPRSERSDSSGTAAFSAAATAPYLPDYVQHMRETSRFVWLLFYSMEIRTHALSNATYFDGLDENGAKKRFPLLFYSHGYSFTRGHSTSYCEELASHGYIVASVSHNLGTGFVRYSDGQVRALDPQTMQGDVAQDPTAFFRRLNESIGEWTADVQDVLDQLSQAATVEAERLPIDFERVGMLGHSFGGATATQLCRNDARFKAGVDMDGGLFGPRASDPIPAPFLFMLTQRMNTEEDLRLFVKAFADNGIKDEVFGKYVFDLFYTAIETILNSTQATHPVYLATILGTVHVSFCDFALNADASLLAPLTSWSHVFGKIDGPTVHRIVTALLVDFFDGHLKNQPTKYLQDGVQHDLHQSVVMYSNAKTAGLGEKLTEEIEEVHSQERSDL